MSFFGRITIAVLICILFPVSIMGQLKVDGSSVNRYSSVLEIYNSSNSDRDSVRVSHPELFGTGDTAVFHIVRGAEIYNAVDHQGADILWGKIYNINNTGIYGVMIIESIIDSLVIFTEILPELINSSKPQMAQLIRVTTADRLIIDSTLSCVPWDPVTGTGGLLVLMANQSITISSTIDVTGTGFRGGQPSAENFGDSCIYVPGEYYSSTAADSAGEKGESIIYPGFPFPLGTGSMATGGGGGNGRFAGGGGGGNYGLGGSGGKESEFCSPLSNLGGSSNYLNPGYFDNIGVFRNRLYFGGGGGSSTQDLPDHRASAGGNGGGIILFLSDSLIFTGNDTIRANGQDVTDIVTAGAGGGGGGGFIVIDAPIITGSVHLEVNGGDGGNTNDPLFVTGPGGFGGAGLIRFNQDSLPENFSIDTLNGAPGEHIPTGFHYGATTTIARNGNISGELVSPLQGFLFNHVIPVQNHCSDEVNSTIKASHAKGGTGIYVYNWEMSDDGSAWITAPGISDEKDYLPGVTGSGKYFRRIVTSGNISDTSRNILFNDYPGIVNNLVEGQSTFCASENTGTLIQSTQAIEGGSGSYSYQWQQKTGDENWETAAGTNDQVSYSPAPLYETTLFRRLVQSEACMDTSNTLKITINQPVTISQQPANDTVIPGNSAIFRVKADGSQPLSYQWYHESSLIGGETADSLVINNTSATDQGDYYCLISNTCGELESQHAILLLESTEGITDSRTDNHIRLYPNPASDFLYLDHPQGWECELQVYDLLGNRIMISRKAVRIDVSLLPQGIYLVRVLHPDHHGVKVLRLEIAR